MTHPSKSRWPVPAPSASSTSTASGTSRRRGDLAGRPRAGQDAGGGRRSTASPRHHRPGRTAWPSKEARRRHPGTPTQMHAAQTLACLKRRQARAGGDPAVRPAVGRPGVATRKKTGRSPCAATRGASTPATSGCAKDRRRTSSHPADGRADLLLPPHQHERAGPAAQLDRPPAVAPRRAHGGPVRLPVRAAPS